MLLWRHEGLGLSPGQEKAKGPEKSQTANGPVKKKPEGLEARPALKSVV